MTGLGVVGFVDDYIKVFKQRSLGLRSGAKMIGIIIIGVVFALLSLRFPNGYEITPATTHLSFLRDFGPSIGPYLFVVWALIMIAGTSNAVNLTDGLDGLAAGAVGSVLGAYVLIGNWQLRNSCRGRPRAELLRRARPARPRRRGVSRARRPRRVPVVERTARARSSWATPARSASAA